MAPRVPRDMTQSQPSPFLATLAEALSPLASLVPSARPGRARVRLMVYDAVAVAGEPAVVRARLERHGLLGFHPAVPGQAVHFFCPPCVTADAATNAAGLAAAELGGSGGRVGQLPVTAHFIGSNRHQPAEGSGRLFLWPEDSRLLVIDVDRSLADLPWYLVPFVAGEGVPARPGAATALNELARAYRVVYLTARPDWQYRRTRAWLRDRGFPPGPLLGPFPFGERRKEGFVRQALVGLKEHFPQVQAAVVGRPADAEASRHHGLQTYLLRHGSWEGVPDGVRAVGSWRELREGLAAPAAPPAARVLAGAADG